MEAQVLIPIDAEIFWCKIRDIVSEVLNERDEKVRVVEDTPQLLKMKQVCDLFKISKPTIYEWMRKGQLRSIKIESRRFFLVEDIQHLVEKSKSV